MGLDMYLEARTLKSKIQDIFPVTGEFEDDQFSYATVEVGYWRKANNIHKWFVNNVQSGKDDCGNYCVNSDDLIKLRDICIETLNNKHLASELLPTQSGFFFGRLDYDDYYFEQINSTIEILNRALEFTEKGWSIYYSSSW
jgi:hypothetical protein